MRAFRSFLPVLAIVGFLSIPMSGVGDTDPKSEAKQRLAVRAAAKQCMGIIESLSDTSRVDRVELTGKLGDLMLKNVGQHANRDKSRKILREYLRNRRLQNFNAELDRLHQRAEEHSPLPVDEEAILKHLDSDWKKQRSDAVNEYVDSVFPGVFAEGREKAVALQKERIAKSISYPSFDVLDKELESIYGEQKQLIDRIDSNHSKELRQWLRGYGMESEEVFAEVESYLQDLSGKMTDVIRKQIDAQIDKLQQAGEEVPSPLASPQQIHSF